MAQLTERGRGAVFFLPLPPPPLSFFDSPFISRAVKTEIPLLGLFFGSETKRKHLLRRLLLMHGARWMHKDYASFPYHFVFSPAPTKTARKPRKTQSPPQPVLCFKKGPQKSLHDLTSSSKNKRGSGNARKFPRSLPRTCFVWFLKVRG